MHIDGGGIEGVLEMDGIVLFNHLDGCAAVLGDLIDVGPLHEAHTYVCVPEAVGGAGFAVAVQFELRAL